MQNFYHYQSVVPNSNEYGTIALHNSLTKEEFSDSVTQLNDHCLYLMICGNIRFNFSSCEISDPNTEVHMHLISWPISDKYIKFFKGDLLSRFYLFTCPINEFKTYLFQLNEEECIEFFKDHPEHLQKFEGKGLQKYEIKMMLYAMRFYTGKYSLFNNRELAYDIKETFLMRNNAVPLTKEIFTINSYFLKGLNFLPIYWGFCIRCLNLSPEEMVQYSPGNIVTWFQFSSSTKGLVPHSGFTDRSCQLIIYSITGREVSDISKFSNEKEVIFLPFSQFLVFKSEIYYGKPTFYLRQIELGIGKNNVLWVDENIFDTQFGYKKFIESTLAHNPLIRFILKTSNNAALPYLESLWGEYQKKDTNSFRIICNDYCKNDICHEGAGVRMLNYAISLGFTCKMMIYSYNIELTWHNLQSDNIIDKGIIVTNDPQDVLNFISFTI